MSYTIEQIDSSEKVEDGKFTGSTGLKNPSSRGLIFEEEMSEDELNEIDESIND